VKAGHPAAAAGCLFIHREGKAYGSTKNGKYHEDLSEWLRGE
jgi:hypothetical protein